jgi:hypothetical protein
MDGGPGARVINVGRACTVLHCEVRGQFTAEVRSRRATCVGSIARYRAPSIVRRLLLEIHTCMWAWHSVGDDDIDQSVPSYFVRYVVVSKKRPGRDHLSADAPQRNKLQ